MLLLAPRTSYDASARRRTRRTAARLRPLLLPFAVVVAAVVVAGALTPAPAPPPSLPGPTVPAGRVLVVLSPADPAVLAVAVPGAVVDVYAAPATGWGWSTPDPPVTGGTSGVDGLGGVGGAGGVGGVGGAGPVAALLVRDALVVGVPPPAGPAGAGDGPLAPALPGTAGATSVTLAVSDEQARVLAGAAGTASGGGSLSLAVRGPAGGNPGPPGGGGD